MHSVTLVEENGATVEFRGLAAEQWQEAAKLSERNRRVMEYMCDVLSWSYEHGIGAVDRDKRYDDDGEPTIYCFIYRSSAALYFIQHDKVIIFWLSQLFRPKYTSGNELSLN